MRIAIYHRKLEEAAQKQLENLMTILRNNHIDAYEIDPLSPENLDADMLFSIGGDGTLLSSVHLIGDSGIPVIGINYGHLGFLTTVGQDDSPETFVHDLLAGNYTIEERTMLHISSPQLSGLQHTALNEVYLRRESADLLRVSLYVDDEFVATYEGDGVLVATPTGSTAYNLSCGGPILTPNSGCFVVTPIGAHNLTLRPMIVPDSAKIRLEPHYCRGIYTLGIDSTSQPLRESALISLFRESHTVRLVRMHNQSFFTAIHEKLAWGTELR
ncbi:MAG: NAD(+)/NADH kinase [Bacteroidales bacterium]|nr:NAD(+)/NADH kinase [Bacteroidales bacterium]